MKSLTTTLSFLVLYISCLAQTDAPVKGYHTYEAFIAATPSETADFRLEQRTQGDIFMMGGIDNYNFGKIKPKPLKNKWVKELWGAEQDGYLFINAYPYSNRKGYNKVLGAGPYRYFIGEPAYGMKDQIELGIIEAGDPVRAVCCKTGFVMYSDGTIKLLTPELLLDILKKEPALTEKTKAANFQQEDTMEMFDILEEYNGKQ